jgi:hypothetical protein
LNESIDSKKPLVVKGVLQRADAKNHNQRVYSYPVLMRESEKYSKEFVTDRRAMGELDHPDSSVVNLKNVSHIVTEMHWDGKDLIGSCEILPTPSGNILKELFRSGVKLGISSRGLGSVEENPDGTIMVQEDFELIAFDFVSNPSTHGAFMAPGGSSLQENKLISEGSAGTASHELHKYYNAEVLIRDILTNL